MKFLLFANVTNQEAMALSQQLLAQLCLGGHSCRTYHEHEPVDPDTDIVLVIGGDGTVLRAVRALYRLDIPFFCVNCGHLGYLSECERDNAADVLRQVLSGSYHLERRAILKGSVETGDQTEEFFALNEIVIHRGAYSHILHLSVEIGNQPILDFPGDGLIICTPTGSTAYNLAAGGPILMPESMCLALTPICPHASLCVPLVVDDSAPVTVNLRLSDEEDDDGQPTLAADSCHRIPLRDGARITCHIDPRTAGFVRIAHLSFYQRLRTKMAGNPK